MTADHYCNKGKQKHTRKQWDQIQKSRRVWGLPEAPEEGYCLDEGPDARQLKFVFGKQRGTKR